MGLGDLHPETLAGAGQPHVALRRPATQASSPKSKGFWSKRVKKSVKSCEFEGFLGIFFVVPEVGDVLGCVREDCRAAEAGRPADRGGRSFPVALI